MPRLSEAPPAGVEFAGPRRDLRGYRLGLGALVTRPQEQIAAKHSAGIAAGLAAGFLVGIALLGLAVPDLLAVTAGVVINLVVMLWLPTMLIQPADRRLLRVVNRSTESAYRSWRRAFGSAPNPRSDEEMLLWLAARPETTTDPDALSIEASMLLVLGRYDAARERAERLPMGTPVQRFDRVLGLAAIDFESGGKGDLTEARAALAAIHGDDRPFAVASLALEEANQAMIRGDDWDPSIRRAVAEVGSPVMFGILTAIGRYRPIRIRVLASALLLAVALYVAARV